MSHLSYFDKKTFREKVHVQQWNAIKDVKIKDISIGEFIEAETTSTFQQ